MGYIYKITNTINKKAYIGVTTQANPSFRWINHKSSIRCNRGCPLLQKAFKKYGEESFRFEVLIICFDENTFDFEKEYITKYNTMSPNGYNVAEGGKIGMSFLGKKHSEETKKIIGEKSKLRNADPAIRERSRQVAIQFNKTHDISELLRISEKWQKAKKEGRIGGRSKSDETKKKISDGLKQYFKVGNAITDSSRKKRKDILTKINGKAVSQFTKEGIFVNSFISITIASNYTEVSRRNINQNLSGRTKTAGGFVWKYNTEPKEELQVSSQSSVSPMTL